MTSAPRFNLSAAALRHRTLTLFFLLLFTLGGVMAYANLGLKEEPEFKFKLVPDQRWIHTTRLFDSGA